MSDEAPEEEAPEEETPEPAAEPNTDMMFYKGRVMTRAEVAAERKANLEAESG